MASAIAARADFIGTAKAVFEPNTTCAGIRYAIVATNALAIPTRRRRIAYRSDEPSSVAARIRIAFVADCIAVGTNGIDKTRRHLNTCDDAKRQ